MLLNPYCVYTDASHTRAGVTVPATARQGAHYYPLVPREGRQGCRENWGELPGPEGVACTSSLLLH